MEVPIMNEMENEYADAVNGDIYLNPFFGDLWIVDDGYFIKINDGYSVELDEPAGFVKVGHVDGVTNTARERLREDDSCNS